MVTKQLLLLAVYKTCNAKPLLRSLFLHYWCYVVCWGGETEVYTGLFLGKIVKYWPFKNFITTTPFILWKEKERRCLVAIAENTYPGKKAGCWVICNCFRKIIYLLWKDKQYVTLNCIYNVNWLIMTGIFGHFLLNENSIQCIFCTFFGFELIVVLLFPK